jgi:hypothetical protein
MTPTSASPAAFVKREISGSIQSAQRAALPKAHHAYHIPRHSGVICQLRHMRVVGGYSTCLDCVHRTQLISQSRFDSWESTSYWRKSIDAWIDGCRRRPSSSGYTRQRRIPSLPMMTAILQAFDAKGLFEELIYRNARDGGCPPPYLLQRKPGFAGSF